MAISNPVRAPLWPLLRSRLVPDGLRSTASVWIQAVSVGEVEIAATLVDTLLTQRPDLTLLVTSSTPAGVALASRRFRDRPCVETRPFPLDFPRSVRRFFRSTQARILVLVETELWPAVLAEAGRTELPVLLVNARLSERSTSRYRQFLARRLFRGPLRAISRVLARTPEDAGRFERIGVAPELISVTGDMKLDRQPPRPPAFAADLRSLAGGRPVLVAGSLADEEVDLALEVRQRLGKAGTDVLLLAAPRRPGSFEAVAQKLTSSGLRVVRRSRLPEGAETRPDVFLLDSLGELAGAYLLGDLAILGGTFAPKGGHNVLEPLRAGLPTLHGPSVGNIRRTLELAHGAVFPVSGAAEAATQALRLLSSPEDREQVAAAAGTLFARHAGATEAAARTTLALLDGRKA